MKRFQPIALLFLTASLFTISQPANANQANHIDKQIITLVNQAAAKVRHLGRIKATCEFNARNKTMGTTKPAIFAYVCNDDKNNGFVLASGNLDVIYTNQNSAPHQAIFRDALHEKPSGTWVTYSVKNPINGKLEQKHSYIMELAQYKLFIGAGYFKK